ncbi:MAG TPA: hypothetical protein VK148_31545 [Xanthobacteraceae bacterium]|nr:hypothetical protein [Xanthobacteraceae bacterium]
MKHYRNLIGAVAFAALSMTVTGAQAFDDSKYPDWKGQWMGGWIHRNPGVTGQPSYDPLKSDGRGQQAPLTPEYQKIHEASLADQANGGPGSDPQAACLPSGMPRMMIGYYPMEIIITPDTTHLLMEHIHNFRRIYTDGRSWPEDIDPSFAGYSIGKWVDEDGDGRYDVLIVETRGLKGPRAFDSTGLPLHNDNQTIVKERIYQDKSNPNIIYDEITTIDNALTRPWTVTKNYNRDPNPQPVWREFICAEANSWIIIGKEGYYVSADGRLMPTRKGQPPPDTTYFKQTQE